MILKPTNEQQEIIETAQTGTSMVVKAFAGASKTTTCVMVAEKLQKHSLYVAFNKSIAEEAKSKFPSTVICKTMHSLAYAAIVTPKMRKKLQGWFRASDINLMNYYFNDEAETRFKIIEYIKLFCYSDCGNIRSFSPRDITLDQKELVVAHEYWQNLIVEDTPAKITHDVYLKLFQLSQPILGYEVIYLDECLTKNQLVKTSTGVRSIKSLYNSWHGIGKGTKTIPDILSYNIKKQIYEYKPMLGAIKSEDRDVLRVKTEGLNTIDCTPNHKLLTQRGYVPAEELVVGKDYLLLDSSKNQKSKILLNDDQYQIVLGSYLGDGSLEKRSDYNTYRLTLTQGQKQLNYLLEKASAFNIPDIRKGYSGYTGEQSIFTCTSKTFILEKPIWECLLDMDEKALAIWYMDDGSLSNSYNVTLHSNKYSYEEQEYLVNILKDNFNITASIRKRKDYYCLCLTKENGKRLLELTAPYINDDVRYKNPFASNNSYQWNNKFKPYGGNYVSSVEYLGKDTVYDITVQDNHNFCTTRVRSMNSVGCIVHNCQDSNQVTMDIVLSQQNYGTQLITVGDNFQSIYAWRNAVNALDNLPEGKFKTLYLTESFRFTQEIADKATKIISYLNNDRPIIGRGKEKAIESKAVIVRNNSTLLEQLLSAYNKKEKVYVLADLKSLWSKLYHIQALYFKEKPRYPDSELKQYKTYKELLEASENLPEIAKLIKLPLTLGHGDGLHKNINNIKSILVKKESDGDFTLTTGHKSKGLEWDEVTLTDDFLKVGEDQDVLDVLSNNQTCELIYVALTRARVKVNLPLEIERLL